MEIRINVSLAISRYNRNRGNKPKMNKSRLAELVFEEDRKTVKTGIMELSYWEDGDNIHRCEIRHLVVICKVTGVTMNELISF